VENQARQATAKEGANVTKAEQLLKKVYEGTASEFGKQWDDRVPRNAIRHHMGHVHVGTPDADVHADIDKAIAAQKARSPDIAAQWTPELEKQTHDYAIAAHRANQKQYRDVMSGTVGGRRASRSKVKPTTAMGAVARAGRL